MRFSAQNALKTRFRWALPRTMLTSSQCSLRSLKIKGKSGTCYRVSYMRRTRGKKRFDNLESGRRLAWANDTAAHYAAIHSPPQRTTGPAVCSWQTYHRPNQPSSAEEGSVLISISLLTRRLRRLDRGLPLYFSFHSSTVKLWAEA